MTDDRDDTMDFEEEDFDVEETEASAEEVALAEEAQEAAPEPVADIAPQHLAFALVSDEIDHRHHQHAVLPPGPVYPPCPACGNVVDALFTRTPNSEIWYDYACQTCWTTSGQPHGKSIKWPPGDGKSDFH